MYRATVFLIFVGFMIRAIVRSRRRSTTIGVMTLWWFVAIGLVFLYGFWIGNDEAAWAGWGMPTFLIPAIMGNLHARSTRTIPS
jgi:cytochrome c oxidase assembly factor CtaG